MKKGDVVYEGMERNAVINEINECIQIGNDEYIAFANSTLKSETGQGTINSKTYFIFYENHWLPMKAIARMAQFRSQRGSKNYHSDLYALAMGRHEFVIHHSSNSTSLGSNVVKKAKERTYQWVLSRPEQSKFRKSLLIKYNSKCVLTGCEVTEALEAAHITPYSETQNDGVENGILLRRDIHRLFDYNLVAVRLDDLSICLAPQLYLYYKNQMLKTALLSGHNLCQKGLSTRWKEYSKSQK